MKYLIKDINKIEKRLLESMGLYCYDLRESDMGDEIANVEKSVFVNKVGNMITNEEIKFEKTPKDFVNYFDFCLKNEQVDKIENLFKTKIFDIDNILSATVETIRNNEEYEGEYEHLEICYILVDKNETIVSAQNEDDIIEICPFKNELRKIADWTYSIDENIFGEIENGKDILYMSINTHYSIWQTIGDSYPEDIEYKGGMQKYLKHCKENNITKEFIDSAIKAEGVYDAMKHYKKIKVKNKDKSL